MARYLVVVHDEPFQVGQNEVLIYAIIREHEEEVLRNIHDIFEERSGTDWWKHTRPTFKQILPELTKKLVTWSHHVTTPWEGAGKGAGKRDVHETRSEKWIVSALTVHEIALLVFLLGCRSAETSLRHSGISTLGAPAGARARRRLLEMRRNCRCGRRAPRAGRGPIAQAADPSRRPPKLVAYVIEKNREKKQNELLAECKLCGVLCSACHLIYDAPLRGGPPAPWEAAFQERGPTAAEWDQYLREFECLSVDCDWELYPKKYQSSQ